MQSRRHEDYGSISPSSKLRNQHRHDGDSFHMPRRETVDRSPSVQLRGLSPNRKNDVGSRRILLRDGRSGSTERRDYGWHLGSGRVEKFHSGSPSFVPEQRKPRFDDGIIHRKYEDIDELVYEDSKSGRLNHFYEYDHHPTSSKMTKEKNYTENRILGIEEGVAMQQKSLPMEDGIVRGSHRVPLDYIPTSNYEKTGSKHQQLPSRHTDSAQYDNEKLRYRHPISPDNLPVDELYKESEKPMFRSRTDSYDRKPPSHLKGYGSRDFKDFAGTSSGISRSEFLSSYREGMPVSIVDEYHRNGMKLTEHMDFNTLGQRSFVERRNIETGKRVLTSYPHEVYSPNRSDHDDYVYPKSQALMFDNIDYPSGEFRRMMPPLTRLDHEQALADYDYRELSKMSAMYPTREKIDPSEDAYSNIRNSSTWDHNIHKQMRIENLDSSRTLYAPKHGEEYFGSEYTQLEFGRRTSRDSGKSSLNRTKDQQISHLKMDYGFGRDAGPQFQKGRLQDPDMSLYDLERLQKSSKRQRIEDEYEQSGKFFERMYRMEDNMNRRGPRTVIVNKNYTSQEYEDGCESGEKWNDEDLNDLRPSRNQRFDHTVYTKAKRTYDAQGYQGDFASEGWSSQESLGHSRKNQVRYYKPGVKFMKSHPRSSPMNWYNSNQNDKRSGIYRKNKTWKINDEHDEDEHEEANGGGPLKDWGSVPNSEPCEDSEEFKQLVHEAYLDFSKKLNLSSAVRRRYQEQGKVGSLFCIVCGRSTSKDFMDTQRLVTHAYMSHKVGLRAQHMGLHKAICVLMGWNTYVPCETTTWVPDVLQDSEAWAQKEDLMLWPPLIIIHNISMSNNNPEQQQVIPIEGVEAFLRGKGFVGGKIRVCLGKPADQSVILVKFLGTFTGLGQAESLNKYFAENKRGREEFEQKTCSSSSDLEGVEGEKIEERLLYGYMGVADDLDKIDFNTKKWITVKSKKDVKDLADAPVKPDER